MLIWSNKHLLPLLIKDKWKAPEELPHLKALVKWVAELRRASLRHVTLLRNSFFGESTVC
jgi:hypothetical protein